MPYNSDQPDPLPLANRYQAAWNENATRIAQRQAALQIYLLTAGVMFGFRYSGNRTEQIEDFFAVGMTLITYGCAAIMLMHNRVMGQLLRFMARCEKSAMASIEAQGRIADEVETSTINLFYFYSKKTKGLDLFHETQRKLHRIVLSAILGVTNGAAIFVAWDQHNQALLSVLATLTILPIIALNVQWPGDRHELDSVN